MASIGNFEIENPKLNRGGPPFRQDSNARVYIASYPFRETRRNHASELNNIHLYWVTPSIAKDKEAIDILDRFSQLVPK